MTHKSVTKPGDIGAVAEVLGWDPRGTSEEYEYAEKAQEAFSRIKKELSALRAANKQEKQNYAELSRMNESYIKHLHTAERQRDEARRDLGEILAVIHRDGGHYTGEHGISKSVADAHATWAAVVRERDEAQAEIEMLRGVGCRKARSK